MYTAMSASICGQRDLGRARRTNLLIELRNLVLGAVLNRHGDGDGLSKLEAMKRKREAQKTEDLEGLDVACLVDVGWMMQRQRVLECGWWIGVAGGKGERELACVAAGAAAP